jgi:hypothetical protein
MSIQRTFIHSASNRVNFFLQSIYNYTFYNRDTHSIIDIYDTNSVKFFRIDNFKEAIDNFIKNKIDTLEITDENAREICFKTVEENIKNSIDRREDVCEWLPGQTVNLLDFYAEDAKDQLNRILDSRQRRTGGRKSKKRRNKKRKTRKR